MNQETIEKVIEVGYIVVALLYILGTLLDMLIADTEKCRTIHKLIIGCIVLVGLSMIILSVYVAIYL